MTNNAHELATPDFRTLPDSYTLRDGRVYDSDGNFAVLYSPGYGAGWSTWGADVFDPLAVAAMLWNQTNEYQISQDQYEEVYKRFNGDEYVCHLWYKNLEIVWMEPGTQFRIEEYDGFERIKYKEDTDWLS